MCGIFASANIADSTPLPILRNFCAANLLVRSAQDLNRQVCLHSYRPRRPVTDTK